MDVDADGSDADRLPEIDGDSANFKPFTSYRWKKRTPRPSPFLAPSEEKLARYEAEFAQKGLTMERNRDLRIGIQRVKAEVDSLKRLQLSHRGDRSLHRASRDLRSSKGRRESRGLRDRGVWQQNCIPRSWATSGQATRWAKRLFGSRKRSIRLATPNNRPVSDLKVTYLIFPGTAETPFQPPDLEKIRARCEKLVQELGASTSVPLYRWANLIPTPTPTPSPTPTASLNPTPSVTPTGIATGSPSASPTASSTPIATATFAFPTPAASETPSPSPNETSPVSPIPTATP